MAKAKAKVKGYFTPTITQALKVLLCAMFRVEMKMEFETENIHYKTTKEVVKK